jgi:hypothetical protein
VVPRTRLNKASQASCGYTVAVPWNPEKGGTPP